MSGGHYDYLCLQDIGELMDNGHRLEQLETIAKRLAQLGHPDASREVYEFAFELKAASVRLYTLHDRLERILHAVEWLDSSDFGEEQVAEVVQRWRERPPAHQRIRDDEKKVETGP